MNPSKQTISLHPKTTTCRNSSEVWSTKVAIGEPNPPDNQDPVVFQLPLEPSYFYIAPRTSESPEPADQPPPNLRQTPLSPPPTPHPSQSSSSSSPGPLPQHSSSDLVIVSPEVKPSRKPAKKVHFALSERDCSSSPGNTTEESSTVRGRETHQDSTRHLPEQASTSPQPATRSGFARPLPIFRCGKLRLPNLKSRRRTNLIQTSSSVLAYRPAQPTTMAPPPLSPYELGPPAEHLPVRRAGYYAPLGTDELHEHVVAPRGASVPTRRYSYPVPILRSPSTSQSRSAHGDLEEEVKITHTQDLPATAASRHLSRHGHAYEVYHFCSICRAPRSRKYHKLHPVESGQRIEPGVCRKCKTSTFSSDEEERVVINRPGRDAFLEMEKVRVIPVFEEREERGRSRYKHRDRPSFESSGRFFTNVQETGGHRESWRTSSDSRVRITIEETVPAHHRRSRSRTVVRSREWDERPRRRIFPPSEDIQFPARPPMAARHISDAERRLRCHPQAFRHGFFTKSKSRTRAPSPPSAQMRRLSVEDQPLPKTRTEAPQQDLRSKRGSQATRTHTSWVTYPASSDNRSTSVLRSGSRPSRPATSPRKHIQARQLGQRAEGLHNEDELRVRFTPGPQDEQARRRRGYDGHFSEEAERMSGYYWYEAPRQLPTAPRQVIPSSEPTDYSTFVYRRHVKEPVSLTVLPRASMSTAPIRAPEPPSAADFEAPAPRTTLPSSRGPSTRLWTQDSANIGSSYAGSRSSYHLVDVREMDATDSMGYPTTVREIEDTRYSGSENDKEKEGRRE